MNNSRLGFLSDINIGESIEEKVERILRSIVHNDDRPAQGLICKIVELAIAEEREACARICDDKHYSWHFTCGEESVSGPRECADLIRQRAAPKDEVSE